MSSGNTISGGTMRGTPNRDRRGGIPFHNSPGGSNIPRPVLEEGKPSEASSSVSASRQKQSKRDEVRPAVNVVCGGGSLYR
jgi:hypothetical protein